MIFDRTPDTNLPLAAGVCALFWFLSRWPGAGGFIR